jgi:NAD(P)-dependent dehydrogenase (short-subunit alcohol dehydrogenase family)
MESGNKQTALVTGGSKGIGSGIVKALVTNGFYVIIADVIPPGAEISAHCKRVGMFFKYFCADIFS